MVLSELHDRAPVHSWESSKEQIEKAFGKPVEELFDSINHAALASGSIAQVTSDGCVFLSGNADLWLTGTGQARPEGLTALHVACSPAMRTAVDLCCRLMGCSVLTLQSIAL